jgi:KaiC/GvpD/RAD55 family RecA-like ATPase
MSTGGVYTGMIDETTAHRELIEQYAAEGWKLLRLHPETKRPVGEEWQKRPGLTQQQAAAVVGRGLPIGAQAGEVSRWLSCVDNDTETAVKLAPHFLPKTLTSGKRGIPSHYVYYAEGLGYTKFTTLEDHELIAVKASSNGRGHQFVIPPSVHPEKGPYEWIGGFDAGRIARVDADELLRSVRLLAAAALIAENLPDKNRHDYSLALSGFLLRGGVELETVQRLLRAAWWAQDAPQEGIEAAARNASDTAEKLARGEPVTGGRKLEERLPGMPRKLARFLALDNTTDHDGEVSEEDEEVNSLLAGRVDLGKAISQGIDPPEELEPDILLKGKIHHLFGPSESGKTIVSLWLIKRRIEARQYVVFFDAENGPRTIAERLKQMGADPDLVKEYLIYLPFPTLNLSAQIRRDFYAMLDRVKPVLIVFDSWASFLSAAGLSENENAEIEHWDNALTKHAKRRDIASVIVDHVPHDQDRSRGGARKKEVADVQWRVKKTKEFNRDAVGEVLLINDKDREGWLPGSVKFSVGGSFGKLICQRSSGTIEDADDGELLATDRKVLAVLCEEFGAKGASASEWQRAADARGVPRSSFYRSRAKLVSDTVRPSERVRLENETYFPPDEPDLRGGGETSENRKDKPNSPRSHEVSNRSHETNETGRVGEVSPVSPPYKGETVRPTAETYIPPDDLPLRGVF